MFAPIWMELTIRYPRKNNGSFAMVGKEKLIHMLPWMTAMSSTGIPAENMAAFGDDFVDIEMLDLCGVGIAMSNAVDEVKKHADVVIDDNDSDAIAEYLHLHVL